MSPELRADNDHVIYGYMLTQCLGGSSKESSLAPCVATQSLPSEARILLCTDGLTDLVPDEQIRDRLVNSEQPAQELVQAALEAGGTDNVTAIVLQLEPS